MAQLDPDAEFTAYRVEPLTRDVQDAGTNATVSVTIFGERGDTGALTLDTTADNFVRASEDSFTLANARNVGAITHVVLGHDESALMGDPAWHVAELKIHNLKTGEAVTFPAGCWIGKEREPLRPHVALAPAGKAVVKMCAYRVAVRTSDVRWAGTDAKVSVRLIEAEGKTSATRVLENGSTTSSATPRTCSWCATSTSACLEMKSDTTAPASGRTGTSDRWRCSTWTPATGRTPTR